ncbi:MAG: M23 family metallopeptidase [Myxococcota bacterium]
MVGRGILVAAGASALLLALPFAARGDSSSSTYGFAPLDTGHDDEARYSLPYPARIPRRLVQGVDGKKTHQGPQRFAFDFLLPLGTKVLAARPGVVGHVIDGHTEGGFRPGLIGNGVYVLHDDGTFAYYGHLSPGISVQRGQRVSTGDLLAKSGNTGYSDAPHLHFQVARRTPTGFRTVPIRFGAAGTLGFVPNEGDYYGARPPSLVRLQVDADGQTVRPGQDVRIERGDSVRLRVYRLRGQAGPVEVTERPQLSFASMTPWSLDADGDGRVRARPMPGYEDFETQATGAEIYVVFGIPGRRGFGYRQIPFEIVDPPARSPVP